ncbi:MAG: DinB family protein [Phycisphaerae bacterium]
MSKLDTFRDLFAHNDWAWARLSTLCTGLSDEQLDRPFEMGEGSLRETINHLWSAERVWLDRWKRSATPRYRGSSAGVTVQQLVEENRELAAERAAFLDGLTDESLDQVIHYTNTKGTPNEFALRDMMLHVTNHGVHHRAQAVNMLRHVGAEVPKPGLDYIFYRLDLQAAGSGPPTLDIETVRTYYEYGDWARDEVHAAAANLSDAQLDRPFELGLGTLRKTLLHIRFAEQWWLDNWLLGPGNLFPETDERTTLAELRVLFAETARVRNLYLSRMNDADLAKLVSAQPRPGVTRTFSLGETMLQLCTHGAHHRAQALNMLRHIGATVPALDVLVMRSPRVFG